MNVLIFNCGSSSQSFKVYQVENNDIQTIACGKARNVATQTQSKPAIEWNVGVETGLQNVELSSHRRAAMEILEILQNHQIAVHAIGHRFVHGGNLFSSTVRIDANTLEMLRQCLPFAPIHNPNSFSVIEVCQEQFQDLPQYAVFDTSFHAGMPKEAKTYALPTELATEYGYQKYGFHGLSCQFVSKKAAELLGRPLESLKLILCHLGTGGSSVTAIKNGNTLDTSMGYSPLAGLVMSTRCGDLDPEIVLDLVKRGKSVEDINQILNQQSGLIGLSGYSSNISEIIEASENGDLNCQLAYDVYTHRLRQYIGGFYWLLNGADAILFTDDIGVKSWKLRQKVFDQTDQLGIRLDRDANRKAPQDQPLFIQSESSKVKIAVIPTDEERVILEEVLAKY